MDDRPFTDAEVAYLEGQRLGRLATVSASGSPQNNPVGFSWNERLGTIDVFGRDLAASRKYRNVTADPRVAFVVDDLASVDPWRPRGIEIRGEAEAIGGVEPPNASMTTQVIRIHPQRVISWNIDPDHPAMRSRTVVDRGKAT